MRAGEGDHCGGSRRSGTDTESVGETQTPSTGLRHPSLRKMPESDARSVEQTLWQLHVNSRSESEFLKYLLFLP